MLAYGFLSEHMNHVYNTIYIVVSRLQMHACQHAANHDIVSTRRMITLYINIHAMKICVNVCKYKYIYVYVYIYAAIYVQLRLDRCRLLFL